MRHRRYQQTTIVLKRDEAPVEEMVDGGRQQQSVLSVEPFLVTAIAPGLAVARPQVFQAINPRNAAPVLDRLDTLPEQPLPPARYDQSIAIRVRDRGVLLD